MRQILVRVIAIFASLVGIGIALKLVVSVLAAVLPQPLARDLAAGWNALYGLLAPAVVPLMAVVILGLVISIFVGRRR